MLNPYEFDGPNANALKILKSIDPTTNKRTWYYVELRQAIGFDSWLASSDYAANVLNGVVVHMATEAAPDSSFS